MGTTGICKVMPKIVVKEPVTLVIDTEGECQNRFLRRTPTEAEMLRSGEGVEDVGLSLCASPLQILVLRFRRTEV